MEGLKRHWRVWREAWRRRRHLDQKSRRDRQEREFLPGALEVQEVPPAPLGRIILWTIVSVFVIAVIWACFGKVDVVATAQGKIVPSGQIKTIQPMEIGRIAAIHVTEGQAVQAGEGLVELDSAVSRAAPPAAGSATGPGTARSADGADRRGRRSCRGYYNRYRLPRTNAFRPGGPPTGDVDHGAGRIPCPARHPGAGHCA